MSQDNCCVPEVLETPPKNIPGSEELNQLVLQDISCVSQEGRQLIIKSFGSGGICASDAITGKTKWEVKGRLPGMEKWMTARGIDIDGLGRLFVCDTNNQCVHMFSLNGDYPGVLLKSGEDSLGTPLKICCCRETFSVVVLHYKNDHSYVSAFCQH